MLFRNSKKVQILNKFTGGFSGARVLLASSYDIEGHEQGILVDPIFEEKSEREI
jgi:hypothetical protein